MKYWRRFGVLLALCASILILNVGVYIPSASAEFSLGDLGGAASGLGDSSVSSCSYENLGWVICPVLRATAAAGDYAFTFVTQNFIKIEVGIFNGDSGAAQAGALIRNFANVLFAIAMLAIIYSLITDQGLSNYNVKRIAPRFIVAVIFVQVSFYICQLFIDISNVVGVTIQQILVENVANKIGDSAMPIATKLGESSSETLSGLTSGVISKTEIAWPLLAPLTAVVMSVTILCSALIIVLIVRKAIVVALILLAPLAFVAYLLPNTSEYFSKWLRMFTYMLVLFPVISVLIGAGQIVSASIIKAGSNDYKVENDTVTVSKKSQSATLYLVAAGAAVLPLAGTWYAFKFAMGAFDSAGTRISQRGMRRSSRERNEDVKKREQTTMDMNKKSAMLRGINRLQQLNVAKDGESTASVFGRAGSYRGRGKHQTKSAEQAKFDDQVQQRLNEMRGRAGGASPQELYSQALQRYQDKLGEAGDNGLNINSYEGIELKASEAYLLESLAKGGAAGGIGIAAVAGGQQDKGKSQNNQDDKDKKSAGLTSLDRSGKSKGGNGGGGGSQQQDSYRPPQTAGGVPATIGQGATVIVQQVASGEGGAGGSGVNQMAGGGTGFAQRRPAQTSNELLAKARAAKYVAGSQDALDVGDELLEQASRGDTADNDLTQDK